MVFTSLTSLAFVHCKTLYLIYMGIPYKSFQSVVVFSSGFISVIADMLRISNEFQSRCVTTPS